MMRRYYAGDKPQDMDSYKIPVAFFTDSRYKGMTNKAKILYGLLLDRLENDAKTDKSGRIYITFPQEEASQTLGIGKGSVINALKELEAANLIERQRSGLGNPDRIYVGRVQK